MGFFSLKNDQVPKPVNTGEYFCQLLAGIGAEASIDTAGLQYPEYLYPMFGKSVYVLAIENSPIRWINLRLAEHLVDSASGVGEDYFTSAKRFIHYIIPDDKLGPDFPFAEIELARTKLLYFVGPPVRQKWRGHKYYSVLLERLNRDEMMTRSLTRSGDISIIPLIEYGFWVLSERTRQPPTQELWDSFEKIARHLLSF